MKGHIQIFTANLLFGVSLPVFKYLLSEGFPPEAITIMRSAFACMMFWIVSFFMPKEKVGIRDKVMLALCTLCGVGVNQLLFVIGLRMSSPVDASIIATAVPIFVLILSSFILKEVITIKKSIGISLGLSGGLILIISSASKTNGFGSISGDILITLNNLMYSFFLVKSKSLSEKYSSVTIMKWMFMFSSVALSPYCIPFLDYIPLVQPESFSWIHLGSLIYLLFGATFLSFMLVSLSLKRIPATTASMYNYLQPIVASLIAIMIGQDTFSWIKVFSAILVFYGIYIVTSSKKCH